MCDVSLALMAATGGLQARSQYQQGKAAYQASQANAAMLDRQAADVEYRGEQDAQAVARQGRQLKGAQRAAMAARGLDLGDGTAAEMLDQTDFFADADVAQTRFNAKREAADVRYSANATRAQGKAARTNARVGAFATLLGTGARVHDKWSASRPLPAAEEAWSLRRTTRGSGD